MSALFRDFNYARTWRGYQKVWSFDIYHPSLDRWLYLFLHRLGRMGQLQRRVIEELVLPGMTVLDIGGNVGLYAALFSRCVGPLGKVITFEPVPELHQALLYTVERNHFANIDTHAYAAGSKDGQVELILDSFNSGNNWVSTNENKPSAITVPVRRVDGVTLDRFPDFVKIDVQGWEVEALRGMTGLLAATHKPAIFFEVSENALLAAGSSSLELGQFLLDYGYELALPVVSQGDNKKPFALHPMNLESLVTKAKKTGYFDILATSSHALSR